MDNPEMKEGIAAHPLDRIWFKLVGAERIDCGGDKWKLRKERIERDRLIVAASERSRIVVDGVHARTGPGTVLICRPGQWMETGSPTGAEQLLYFLDFEQGALADGREEPAADGERPFFGMGEWRIAAAARMGEAIHRGWRSGEPAGRMRAQAIFHELLALLIEKQGSRGEEAPDRVKEEIERRFREELSVERLADLCGVSRYHLMRSFKERYGQSIVEYVTEVRLRHAKRLMQQPGLAVGEIAERVGFQSESYLRTVFKKQVGIAPAVYLRNRRRKVAAYSWPVFGQLLPLEVVPYAAPLDHYWTDEFRRKYGGDVAVPLGHQYEFNRNALRRARPDCIIGLSGAITPEEASRLSEIAPLLLLPWMEAGWRRHLQLVADFLERTEDAEQWLERYDRKAGLIRERIGDGVRDDKVLVLKVVGDRLSVLGRKAMTVLYDDLRLAPAALAEGIEWFEQVELERLSDCDADRIILSVNEDARSRKRWASLRLDETWNGLRAVRAGAVHLRPGPPVWVEPWLENTALDHSRLLDAVPDLFLCTET